MKNISFVVLASSLLCVFQPLFVRAQGALTPPGAPAPTMKSLDQIEPRTPVAANTTPGDANDTYIISQPGSYYLTTNIAITTNNFGGHAIEILANNVTLDLNGFFVSCASTNAGSAGIYIANTQTNITVRNGSLTGWHTGVFSLSAFSASLIFEKLCLVNCNQGSSSYGGEGINAQGAAVVRDCNFENDYFGIYCNNSSTSAMSLIADCTVADCTFGILLVGGGVIRGCTVNNCSSTGIDYSSGNGGTVSGCEVNNANEGIVSGAGRIRIENNHVTGTIYGILIVGGGSNTNNIIIGNTVVGSGVDNYTISSGQISGPIISTTGTISSTSPWANFSF